MGTFRDLTVYRKAFDLAMKIYHITKSFPQEEKYALVSQMRRSSRSVCSSIGEAYRKRLYKAHFVSKITDSDMENTETQVWIDFALACNFISGSIHSDLLSGSEEIGKMLHHMIEYPFKYGAK